MRTCLRVLATGQILIMSELLHEVAVSVEPGTPSILETPLVASILTTRSWPIRQNGLAPAEWCHTLATTESRFWAGAILHWAAYTLYWRLDIIMYEKNMRKCLRTLAIVISSTVLRTSIVLKNIRPCLRDLITFMHRQTGPLFVSVIASHQISAKLLHKLMLNHYWLYPLEHNSVKLE